MTNSRSALQRARQTFARINGSGTTGALVVTFGCFDVGRSARLPADHRVWYDGVLSAGRLRIKVRGHVVVGVEAVERSPPGCRR